MLQMDRSIKIKEEVKRAYGQIATSNSSCCGESTCCTPTGNLEEFSNKLGYSIEELKFVPENSNLGLGCGNPQAIASIKKGEIVLDLGSGTGFDCFLASRQVGIEGKVIGVDMTPQMIEKANYNREKGNFSNVEFKFGEIENLPIDNENIDVIISNCVINLSPDKKKVFNEAFRVLKKGGRIAISDIISKKEMPKEIKMDLEAHSACISGASSLEEVETMLKNAGFIKIKIEPKSESKKFIQDWSKKYDSENYIISASITAEKPKVN